MLIPIHCLSEIVTAIPNGQRRFHVKDELMGLDPDKAITAMTFKGIILTKKSDEEPEEESEQRMIDVMFEGGIQITTLLTEEIQESLFKRCDCEPLTFDPSKRGQKNRITVFRRGAEQENYPTYRRKDINSWN